MKFSLILATISRVDELYRFFDSLLEQTYKGFEVIVVDQNSDNRLDGVINNYSSKLEIQHVKIEPNGLSNARNVGLREVSGEVVAFPDDDCWYPKDLLFNVNNLFKYEPEQWGFTGRCENEKGEQSVGNFPRVELCVEKSNVFKVAVSITIFVKYDSLFSFDEELGVGSKSKFKSGEETDYILQLLQKGKKLKYSPSIVLGHPSEFVVGNFKKKFCKARQYGLGFGNLLSRYNFSIGMKFKYLVRPVAGGIVNLILFRFSTMVYYFGMFIGRLDGLFSNKNE